MKSTKMREKIAAGVSGIALLIALGCGPALAAPTPESERYHREATVLTQRGDVAAAIIQLKNALREDPDNSAARFDLGMLYLRTGDSAAAQRELENAQSRGFDPAQVTLPLAQSYLAQGQFKDVIGKISAEGLPNDVKASVLATQARAQIAQQETVQARTLVDNALAADPNSPMALAADAILLRLDQKFAEAEAQIDKGLESEPDQSELLVLKGELRQQQQDLEGALEYFDLAVEKYPMYARARVARAMANLSLNKPEMINADVSAILASQPENPFGLYLRAYLFSQEQKYKDAQQILMALPQLLDSYAPARYLLAAVAYADNQLDLARANAEQFLSKAPGDPVGTKLLAAIAQRQSDAAKAIELLEPLAQNAPDDNDLTMQLASAYLDAGRSEEAVALFEKGISENPENTQARLALAVGQLRSGASEAGITQLESLVNTGSNALQASTLLVLTHLQGREFDKALSAAETLAKNQPDDPNAYNLMGTVSLAANDLDAARKHFNEAIKRDSDFVAAYLNLAKVEERDQKPERAQDWYEEALDVDSKNLTAFQGLANLALAKDDVDGAAGILQRAISMNPENMQPRAQLVDMLLARQQNSQAMNAARSFADAAPRDPTAIDALARAQIATGDFLNGIGSYERLAAELPTSPEVQRRLGRALVQSANTKTGDAPNPRRNELLLKAKTAFDQAIKIGPEFEGALIDRLSLERELNGDEAALELAGSFMSERPESVTRMVVAGDLQSMLQKREQAEATYKKAWEDSQNSAVLQRYYGSLVRAGKQQQGLKILQNWVRDNPNDYNTRFLIASAHIEAGRFDEALAETESMSGQLPDNPVLLNNLAWLHGEKGNHDRAFEMAARAVELAPEAPEIIDTLGWLEVSHRDVAKGTELLEKAHELAPNSPDIGYHYAAALHKKGNASKAREVLQKILANDRAFPERKNAEALLGELSG